jgi:hypothetical protein
MTKKAETRYADFRNEVLAEMARENFSKRGRPARQNCFLARGRRNLLLNRSASADEVRELPVEVRPVEDGDRFGHKLSLG